MAPRTVFLILGAWLAAAYAAAATGVLAHLPVPPPAIAVGLTVLLLLAFRLSRTVRAAAWSLGPRPLVAFHLTRLAAGAYFLVLYRRGVLPGEFAIAAGWGDIAVGVTAAAVMAFALPVRTRRQRWALAAWNAAGLVEILAVLANGIRLFTADPAFGAPFTALPLALLPAFVVPLVIASHVLLFGWASPRALPSARRSI
jgi:hypothetical protein